MRTESNKVGLHTWQITVYDDNDNTLYFVEIVDENIHRAKMLAIQAIEDWSIKYLPVNTEADILAFWLISFSRVYHPHYVCYAQRYGGYLIRDYSGIIGNILYETDDIDDATDFLSGELATNIINWSIDK